MMDLLLFQYVRCYIYREGLFIIGMKSEYYVNFMGVIFLTIERWPLKPYVYLVTGIDDNLNFVHKEMYSHG